MKQKPFFRPIALLLGALFLLAACGAPQAGGQPASAAGAPASSAVQPSGEADTIPDASEGEPLRLVTGDENFSSRKTTGNENGYYYVDQSDGINANLRYIDYATAQDIYLSSRPEANHLTPEDDSYISSVAGLGLAFPAGDSLFLLRAGAPMYADQFGQDALAAVFRMELDGSGRRQIYTGSGDEILLSGVAADDASLYLVSQRVQEDADSPMLCGYLVRIDQRTGEAEDLCQLSSSAFLIGAGDGLLVFHNIVDTEQEGVLSRAHEIFVYDVASGTLSTLQTWSKDLAAVVAVWDDRLITASPLSRTVSVRALRAEEAAAEYPLPDTVSADLQRFLFPSCHDGRFLFWDYLAQTIRVLNLSTGEWSDIALKYTDPVKDDPRPAEIYAETATHFLVCCDKKTVTRRYVDPDAGTVYEAERVQPIFALIAKEDYWAGVPNYTPVAFVE